MGQSQLTNKDTNEKLQVGDIVTWKSGVGNEKPYVVSKVAENYVILDYEDKALNWHVRNKSWFIKVENKQEVD